MKSPVSCTYYFYLEIDRLVPTTGLKYQIINMDRFGPSFVNHGWHVLMSNPWR